MGLGSELDTHGQRFRFCHPGEILFYRYVRAEMEIVLQLIAVDVPHTVEITGSEPIGVEDLFGFGATDSVKQQTFELVVREPVLGTGTDVVVVAPELFRHLRTADPFQESTAVLYRGPFQYAADRHMEHDRVVVLEDCRIEDTRLTKGYPRLDARVGDDTLCQGFGQTVVVVCGDTDRITCASPMERFATITHLRYRTDIDHFRLLLFGLRQDGFGDVLCGGDIRAQSSFRTIVRLWRNHTAYMQNDVCAFHALEHIVVVSQIAPDNVQLRVES